MTEEEKLDAGLYYDFGDAGVNGRKLNAIKFCREPQKMQDADATEDEQAVLFPAHLSWAINRMQRSGFPASFPYHQ